MMDGQQQQPLNYAKATEVKTVQVDLTLKHAQAVYSLLVIDGADVHFTSPPEVKASKLNRTVTYKCFCPKTKKIMFLDKTKIRKCLAPVMGDVSYVERSETYATIEVKFRSAEEAQKHLIRPLKPRMWCSYPLIWGAAQVESKKRTSQWKQRLPW